MASTGNVFPLIYKMSQLGDSCPSLSWVFNWIIDLHLDFEPQSTLSQVIKLDFSTFFSILEMSVKFSFSPCCNEPSLMSNFWHSYSSYASGTYTLFWPNSSPWSRNVFESQSSKGPMHIKTGLSDLEKSNKSFPKYIASYRWTNQYMQIEWR